MVKNILDKFDTQKLFFVGKIIFILATLVLIVNVIGSTASKYESIADVQAEASVAFFIVDQGTYEGNLSLTGLTPSSDSVYYTFYVRNYDEDNHLAEVNLTYEIKVETTTNLPLEFEVTKGSDATNLITSFTTRQDDDGVFYKTSNSLGKYNFNFDAAHEDTYTVKVTFPETYKNYPDYYSGYIDLFSIIIYAEQVA